MTHRKPPRSTFDNHDSTVDFTPRRRIPQGHPSEPVILRVRMKRRFLDRLKAIVAYDKSILRDTWDLSAACREVLHAWMEKREREIETAKAAAFSGVAPSATVSVPARHERTRRAAN